jgi:hypothetical protein
MLNAEPAPGVCPVVPQTPPAVILPEAPGPDGHHVGIPVPRPIMPPLTCVLPQADGSPILVPMLPAMYMAACGKNSPRFMGTVPLQQSQADVLSSAHAFPGATETLGVSGGGLGHPAFPGFAPPMHFGGPAGPEEPFGPSRSMTFGALPGPRPGWLLSGRMGSGGPSTLPPLLADPENGSNRRVNGGANGHEDAGSHRSRRLSEDSMDKDDRPWTPKGRGNRGSVRNGSRVRRMASRSGDSVAMRTRRSGEALVSGGTPQCQQDGHLGGLDEAEMDVGLEVEGGTAPGPEEALGEFEEADVDELLGALGDDGMGELEEEELLEHYTKRVGGGGDGVDAVMS